MNLRKTNFLKNTFYTLISMSFLLLTLFSSCNEAREKSGKSNYYIEGIIDGQKATYSQVNFNWTNVSNKYFTKYKETWLQGYKDSSNIKDAYWKVRVHALDIHKVTVPYVLKSDEGSIQWYDSAIDTLISKNEKCQGVDSGCSFFMVPNDAANRITITKVSEHEIEGTFEGTAVLKGTGFIRHQDNALQHTITKGKFKIQYREE